ncbi:nitrogenase component 1 [Syntrophomonas wolfei]|jgi:nitrogenase molybdenum-cofactor synthesis protein NifE|nr:nitrogenase component 1 [Syntrophomonas wolfei]
MACAPYSLSITELKTAVESGTRKLLDGGSLRYCPPSAGGWGIIRVGLLVPESIMLFVSPAGCGRHGAIAGLQLGFRQRLFFLYVDEVDLVTGRHLERAKEAVEEILASISRPRAIMICATCIDDLLVSDYEKLAEEVENDYRIPVRACHMNPIAMDGKKPPQLTIQKAIHEFIPAVKQKEQAINMLGSFAAINRGSEFYELMAGAGVSPVRHIAACSTFDDLCSMGRSFYNVLIKPGGKLAAEYMAKALNIPYCYAPVSYGLEAIAASYRKLEEQLGISLDTAAYYEKTEKAINYYRKILGSISIAVGENINACPFELARALLSYGFEVPYIFTDQVLDIDRENINWLAERRPHIKVFTNAHPSMANFLDEKLKVDLAIGFDAGYFCSGAKTAALSMDCQAYGFEAANSLLKEMTLAMNNPHSHREQMYAAGLVL